MKKAYLLLALFCLLLIGCGRGQGVDEGQSGSVSAEQSVAGSLQEDKSLYVKKVNMMQFQEPEEGYTEYSASYKVLDNKIYMLRVEGTEDRDALRVCVQAYDTKSKKIQQYLIEPRVQGHEDSRIFSADITAGLELSLKMKDEGQGDAFFLVRMNLEGDILRVDDVFPEDTYPWNLDPWADIKAFDLADGRTVICRYDAGQNRSVLTWYQEDTGETPLGTLESDIVNGMMIDPEGILYYLGGDSLVRWDVENNTRELLFRLHENGIQTGWSTCGLAVNDKAQLLICLVGQGKGTIYVMTDEEIPDEDKIRLCSLQGKAGIYYFQKLAATFPQHGGNVRIGLELEEREEYQEDYRNRILAEMTVGKGPDILYVSQEDMILLQEKGLLCDLSELIPQEIKGELIPGVLELGTVNGELVGLVPEASFTTMSVASQIWDKDSWTIDDFIEQMETKEHWECLVNWSGFGVDGHSLFYILFSDLADSFVLNLEQGTCDFNNEKFVHILEFCQKYGMPGDRQQLDKDERVRMFKEGDMAAEINYLYGGLEHFSDIMARNGEVCHIVGYPSEKGSGNYVDSYSYGYLVVNAQTKYKEEIQKYFALLLDYDNQFETSGGPVRMDVIRNCVDYDEFNQRYYQIYSNDPEYPAHMVIALKPDGTTYLEEFLEFVASCEPRPYCPPQISAIISEELNLFFDGSKSAEETAAIIQRRVQLYLDERK